MSAGSVAVPNIIALKVSGTLGKNTIDTDTLIELKSDTPNTDVFFTIDGSKPQPYAPVGMGKSTFRYEKSFKIPMEGRITIKSVAVTREGHRESNVVSKQFTVVRGDNDNGDSSNDLFKRSTVSKRSSTPSTFDVESSMSTSVSSRTVSSKVSKKPPKTPAKSPAISPALAASLICPSCCAPRLSKSSGKFCPDCGILYPMTKADFVKQNGPPISGTMGMCLQCRSYVPLDLSKCIVCEAPIKPQLPNTVGDGKLICSHCKTPNEAHLDMCIVCDGHLNHLNKASVVPKLALADPNIPEIISRIKCSACKVDNLSSAQFCSECGKKLAKATAVSDCPRCHTRIGPNTHFCPSCGSLVRGIVNG